jgi:hypothetical protein
MTRKIYLRIDRLVLDGVGRIDAAAFERSLKTGIAESLGAAVDSGGLRGIGSTAELDGGRMAKPSDPAALGRHIGGRIVRSGS